MRVGRGPLDEEAIRLIEAGNPDLEFDWTRILKGQPVSEPQVERRRPDHERRGPDRERRGQDREGSRERERDRRKPSPPAARPPAPKRAPQVEEQPAAELQADEEPVSIEENPTSAAHARLGSEGLARLRARYSEMLARISDRVSDPDRQGELKSLAERLNPDAWVTEADVNAALESYESTFAALRAEFIPARPESPTPPAGE